MKEAPKWECTKYNSKGEIGKGRKINLLAKIQTQDREKGLRGQATIRMGSLSSFDGANVS